MEAGDGARRRDARYQAAAEKNRLTRSTRMKTESSVQELFNRTGIMTHAELSAELIQGAKEAAPSSEGDLSDLAANRAEYLEEALPIGSKPVPVADREITGDGETASEGTADGQRVLPLLLDKLGER